MKLPVTRKADLVGLGNWTIPARQYMQRGEPEVILALISAVKPKTVIEFGCNEGRTAQMILKNISSVESYIGIDVEQDYQTEIPSQVVEVPPHPGWMVLHDRRFQLVIRPRGSLDLTVEDLPRCDAAFIDGDHGYNAVLHDSHLACDLIKSRGIIIWHDYNDSPMEVKRALDELYDDGWQLRLVEGTWLVFEQFL